MINYSFSYGNLEFFLLILIRLTMFFYSAPFFSQKGIPNQVKIGLSFFMAILLYGVIPDKTLPVYNTVWGYAVLVLREALAGLLIGFAAAICTTVVSFAGRIIDMETGLSMSNLIDPATNSYESVTVSSFVFPVVDVLSKVIVLFCPLIVPLAAMLSFFFSEYSNFPADASNELVPICMFMS